MNYYPANENAALNNEKVKGSNVLFWVSNNKEKKELSEAFNEIGRENTARSVLEGYVYMVDQSIFSKLKNVQNVTMNKALGKPLGIENANGLKVCEKGRDSTKAYDRFLFSIFEIMKNDNTTAGREGNKTKNNNSIKKKDNTSTWKKDNPEI